MKQNNTHFQPIISSVQKIALYETKNKYYLIGSNYIQTRFRVLKIDRTDPKSLVICDDKIEYNDEEIRVLINRIEYENRHNGVSKILSAFGIVGFIKFLEGYYIILITKRCKVAVIGYHSIYKIKDTAMIYIPHESVRYIHPDEYRYVKMFQNIDLASNFYFSYSYDLTHTLQYNLTVPKIFNPILNDTNDNFEFPDDIDFFNLTLFKPSNNCKDIFGVRAKPHRKFVWNSHLLKDVEKQLHPDWHLYVTHGFVGQSNINIFGKSIYVTLVARRSARYAGTRFLKRGANYQGDVANEVETEQMVHDSDVSSFNSSHFTSFVQMRGSIPGHWKQGMGKMVAKPAITIDLYDPYAETAGAHFNELLKRYGAPIYVLNLVKQHEHKKQEKLLSDELNSAVKYLNQFLPYEYQIIYKTFDMARKSKSTANVMEQLATIANNAVMKIGLFHNQRTYYTQKPQTIGKNNLNDFSIQTGIIRTNCVDCLDRTNTAQFAIGKCVLGYQLCALGILDSPKLEFDTDCVRMLECLYEDHGDTLALQYGGSQLVHRIKTYRKTAPWTSQGNDIMQTLSRYYSNKFSDADKQNTINLFLGVFIPEEGKPQIWEYTSDYFLHHQPIVFNQRSLSQWWDKDVIKCLPYAFNDLTKSCYEIIQIHSKEAEMIDAYSDYHRPHELSILSDVYALQISNSIRDFMPNFTTDYSPFIIRIRPVKRREDNLNNKGLIMKNPSVSGQSSTSSTTSSTSSSNEDNSADDEDSIYNSESRMTTSTENNQKNFNFKLLFPTMKEIYGTDLKQPKHEDVLIYKTYTSIGTKINEHSYTPLKCKSHFNNNNSSFNVTVPKITSHSINIYKNYIKLGQTGNCLIDSKKFDIFQRYIHFK